MKKKLLLFSVILLLLFACIYLFIPNKIIISEKKEIAANQAALFRSLGEATNWEKWWPGEKKVDSGKGITILNGLEYKVIDKKVLSFILAISKQKFKASAELMLLEINKDTSSLIIESSIPTSYNPITRAKIFFTARKIKKGIKILFDSINSYYSKTGNLYGYDIQKKSVIDSTLISTFKEVKGNPSIEIIYSLIDELKSYIKQHSANETGYPMLNIFTKDSITYLLKVAIPVDRKLPSSRNIAYRWMLGGGNILITEVKGGNAEIQKAYYQVQHYISDHNRIAPAIPFESLVTDRRKETDSTKWITRIYYPVM